MSKTPETDANAGYPDDSGCWKYNDLGLYVDTDFARRLERERDEALMGRANGDIATMTRNHYERILRERDEARDEISSIRNTLYHNGQAVGDGDHDYSIIEMIENLMQSRDYFIRKSNSLECERDEARAIAYDLAVIASHCIGSHTFSLSETSERIADTLKRWRSTQPCEK